MRRSRVKRIAVTAFVVSATMNLMKDLKKLGAAGGSESGYARGVWDKKKIAKEQAG